MATFTVDFLGCKVSQTDAQEIRERLVADGHVEAGERAGRRRREHVLRHARGGAQVAAGGAPGRARTRGRVYVTGCGANLAGDAFAGLPENVTVVRLPGERTPRVRRAATSARSAASRPTSASIGSGRS